MSLGPFDRPIVAGFFIFLITGQAFPAMYVAAFFELIWIDLIPGGTFIPPNALFCLVATMAMIEIFGLTQASQIFLVMLLTIPMAFAFSWLEGKQRAFQNKNYNAILQQSRKKAFMFRPQRMIAGSLIQSFAMYLVAGSAAIFGLVHLYGLIGQYLIIEDFISWAHLLMVASISALAALRVKKAYFSLVVVLIALSAFLAWEMISA